MGKTILIKNIHVYGRTSPISQLRTIFVNADGRLSSEIPTDSKIDHVIDAKGCYSLMPGLLDSHVHGQGGYDFSDVGDNQQQLAHITQALGRSGLSYAMATLVSLDLETLKKVLKAINDYMCEQELAPMPGATKIVGIHLEGPFISRKCKGAHAEAVLQKAIDMDIFTSIISVAPAVTQWKITLAPDLPGAIQFIKDIKQLEKQGISVKVFLGHANPEDLTLIDEAIHAGAAGFTHLGNACQETCSRESRLLKKADATSHLVQWVLANPQSCPAGVELIADGMHLSSSFISLMRDTLGDKIVLITDALGPTGLSGRDYTLGPLRIIKEEQYFYLADIEGRHVPKKSADGMSVEAPKTLAGSASSMADCIRWYVGHLEKNFGKRMQSIYMASISNARTSALSSAAIDCLPDSDNFIILNDNGQLVMSNCNRQIQIHHEDFLIEHFEEPTTLVGLPLRFFRGGADAATSAQVFGSKLGM